MNWLTDASPAPKLLVLPPAAADLGEADAAIELWEHYSGKTLDDTQRLAVQVMMALAPDAKWAAKTTGREMPRQNGKGDEIEVVELWGLVQRAEAILHTVHDAVLLASQTQQRMLGVLEGHADLSRLVKRKWQGTGQQMIEMRNGGIIWYRTRTGGGGRGVDDIDRLVVDEAQHATAEQVSATSPTGFANTNFQVNAMGTAGLTGHSAWWWSVRKRALSDDPGAFGYVGHTAETVYLDDEGKIAQDPVDAADRSKWPECNPAVASGRGGGMGFLEEQFRLLGPERFAEEHLCVWADPPPDGESDLWQFVRKPVWKLRCTDDTESTGWLTGPVTVSLEMDGPQTRTTISVAGQRPDAIGALVAAVVPMGPGGTGQVLDLLEQISTQTGIAHVVIDEASPAVSLSDPVTSAGYTITAPKLGDVKKATATLVNLFAEGGIEIRTSPELDAAASVAKPRKAGEGHVIDRWSDGDASPLIGVNLAVWGHMQPVAAAPEPDFLVI